MPECFAETPDGLLLVANGHDEVMRWDGMTSFMETAGVAPPEDTPVVSGSGSGPIVGEYYGYLRYVDRLGNFSNLSTISAVYNATGSTGSVSGASNATPIVITTSAAHGLTSGATVKIEGVGGNTGANGTWAITVLSSTTFSLDDSFGSGVYNGGGTWTSGVLTVVYSSLDTPTDAKVTRRQILRNTDGQTDTFYVDIDTTDLSSSSLSSTRDDDELSTRDAVPFLDADGNAFANRFGVPPNHKSVIVHHQGRMWGLVDREYKTGMVQVASGSATVTGVGTGWTSSMAGRFLWVSGAGRHYEIDTVDTSAQTLTLLETYTDVTDLFADYAIRPADAERRLLYYSEAGLPEAWPATNALEIQEDGDTLTGLMSRGPYLYILENRHIQHLTFGADPEQDGGIFPDFNRGCVNQRCWLTVDHSAFMLDEEGIWSFGGRQGQEAVSEPIGDLFATTTGDVLVRINWEARDQFHAVHFLPEATMRWFLCLDGGALPKHAICYNYRDQRFWLERFERPVSASVVGNMRHGTPQQFFGSLGDILAYGGAALDGYQGGTHRGTVTSAEVDTLVDTAATFQSEIVGNPVAIVAGRGKGQVRLVSAISGTTLRMDQPWVIMPDTTSVYQLGGIRWLWRSGWFRLFPSEKNTKRRLETVFQPLENEATFDLRMKQDFSDDAYNWGTTKTAKDGGGVESEEGAPDLICHMERSEHWHPGLRQKSMDGNKELFMDGFRFLQVEMEGFASDEQIRIYEVNIDGAVGKS